MSPKKATNARVSKQAASTNKGADGFSSEEKAAMKERAKEVKAEARAKKDEAAGNASVLEKIAEMAPADAVKAKRLHEIIRDAAPGLAPKTWYGMPAYAKDGKVVCFFQSAQKFNTRYCTFGFSDVAKLDDGEMWATAFAITELSAAVEAKIVALVVRAARE